jgi:hypothetical protein
MRSQLEQASCPRACVPPRSRSGPRAAWTWVLVLTLAGCGSKETGLSSETNPATSAAAPADPDDVPLTEADVPTPAGYAEAVERLYGYRDAICQAVESGHLSRAHRPLDETNIAIERLPAIARSSGVPRRDWEQVVTAAEDLVEALDEIHSQIDAGNKPDYASRAEAIDSALARLKAITQTNSKNGSTD